MTKIYDMHADILYHFLAIKDRDEHASDLFRKYHLDNFKKGNVALSVFTLWNDKEGRDCRQRLFDMMDFAKVELELAKDIVHVVKGKDDIVDDKINALIGVEGLRALYNTKEMYDLYDYGVRIASLTWNDDNRFAHSCMHANIVGLSEAGEKMIKIMNELGIIIDVSHLSRQGVFDILEISKDPVVASHSNAWAVQPHLRNLQDDAIKAIAAKGGLIGLNAMQFVLTGPLDKATLEDCFKHIDYIKNLVGIDHIGLGFDFCGYLDIAETGKYDPFDYVDDLFNQGDVQNLVNYLELKGYTQEEIDKICYKNFERIIKQVLK